MQMLVINFYGGPGAGKSTLAAEMFVYLRALRGPNVELCHEFATELCFDQARANLKDQMYLLGQQWHRLWRLEQNKVEIAISDSPLLLGTAYGEVQECPYGAELSALRTALVKEHTQYNIHVMRDIYATGGFKGNTKKKNNYYANLLDKKINKLPVTYEQEVMFMPGIGWKVYDEFMRSAYGFAILQKIKEKKNDELQ
jgi:hypothetical protein